MIPYTSETAPGRIIALRREELSLTQAELAQRLGDLSVGFISLMEAGRSRVPLEKAMQIADALEMDKKWFIQRVMQDRFPGVHDFLFGAA